MLVSKLFSPLAAVVGLEMTHYVVEENVGVANVCAIVYSSNETNQSSVAFSFDIHFGFSPDSASMKYTSYNIISY